MPLRLFCIALVILAIGCSAPQGASGDPTNADAGVKPEGATATPAGDEFEGKLRPMLVKSCSPCHVGKDAQKGVDVEFVSKDEKEVLKKMHDEVEAGKMPPKTAPALDEATKAELLGLLAEAAK